MVDDIEPVLTSIPTEGEAYRDFAETARWAVSHDGQPIGEIWRAERRWGKPVVCWMTKPAVLGFSLPHSTVISGYSRTSRKGSADELIRWHLCGVHSLQCGDWKLHCASARPDDLSFLAMHPDLGHRWVHASRNEEPKPYRGAMGGVGWQLVGRRGIRTVIVHDVPTLEEGVELFLAQAGRRPAPEDVPRHPPISGLPVERHYPFSAPRPGGR